MSDDATILIATLAGRARAAARHLAGLSDERKSAALLSTADMLRQATSDILEANALDLERGRRNGLSDAMLDRLRLDEVRIEGIAAAVATIAVAVAAGTIVVAAVVVTTARRASTWSAWSRSTASPRWSRVVAGSASPHW